MDIYLDFVLLPSLKTRLVSRQGLPVKIRYAGGRNGEYTPIVEPGCTFRVHTDAQNVDRMIVELNQTRN